jgi:hypothetical protein
MKFQSEDKKSDPGLEIQDWRFRTEIQDGDSGRFRTGRFREIQDRRNYPPHTSSKASGVPGVISSRISPNLLSDATLPLPR